ncbi:MAG: hypothetical protein ACI85I_002390, partial [Arenicella sp.]
MPTYKTNKLQIAPNKEAICSLKKELYLELTSLIHIV